MKKKLYWGLGILIVLLIGAFVFVMNKNQIAKDQSETRQLETDLAEVQKKLEVHNKAANTPKVVEISDVKPPPAEPGFKWVRHGDHWDKIPVGQREKIVEPVKPMYTGPLTYHEELLETNPVKALRLQQEERGHWSAEWIPPFPPDDTEAQEYAKALYLRRYYIHTYGEKLGTPGYEKETKVYSEARAIASQMFDTIVSYPYGARRQDLKKLTWPSSPDEPVGGAGGHPSEYFGDAKARELMKELGGWKY